MKIRVKEIVKGCMPIRVGDEKSDCIDLQLGETLVLKKGEFYVARLGVAMQLPKGMIARVYPRSSTPKRWKIIIPNSLGFIDNTYQGDQDEWKAVIYALEDTVIPKGVRLCQFEVKLSQFASLWDKIRWLFDSSIKLIKVDSLGNVNRGGIGSTGK